jgi:DNA-binding response OmpR family regulator
MAPRQLRVLIADDDRDSALTLMMLLREEGHEVQALHSGRRVMATVIDFDPDVLILDIAMPELSGWEVTRLVRTQRGDAKPLIIGVSGSYKQGADRLLSQMLGMDHYFLKPYDPNALIRLLASYTACHQSATALGTTPQSPRPAAR